MIEPTAYIHPLHTLKEKAAWDASPKHQIDLVDISQNVTFEATKNGSLAYFFTSSSQNLPLFLGRKSCLFLDQQNLKNLKFSLLILSQKKARLLIQDKNNQQKPALILELDPIQSRTLCNICNNEGYKSQKIHITTRSDDQKMNWVLVSDSTQEFCYPESKNPLPSHQLPDWVKIPTSPYLSKKYGNRKAIKMRITPKFT